MSTAEKILHNDYLALIVRLTIGVIFIYASLDKISQPSQFARIIYNYHLAPADLVNIVAIVLPWVELICGISIIFGIYKQGAVLVFNFLVVVFIVAVAINVIRGVDLECGCFTVSSRARGNALSLLFRDIGLLILTLYALYSRSNRFQLIKDKA